MKFIISSDSLLKNLQVLGSILNNNNTLPILDCFLFEIENKDLFITSVDTFPNGQASSTMTSRQTFKKRW